MSIRNRLERLAKTNRTDAYEVELDDGSTAVLPADEMLDTFADLIQAVRAGDPVDDPRFELMARVTDRRAAPDFVGLVSWTARQARTGEIRRS